MNAPDSRALRDVIQNAARMKNLRQRPGLVWRFCHLLFCADDWTFPEK
jgi:hypothetical protein